MVVAHHRAPDRVHDLQFHRRPAPHGDAFHDFLIHPRTRRCEVAAGVAGIGLHDHPVQPVAVAVGESPRDPAVGADDKSGCPGQGDAHDLPFAVVGRPSHGDMVPGVGEVQPQMHVIGQQGTAVGSSLSCNRPVVAAEAGVEWCGPPTRLLRSWGPAAQVEDVGGRQIGDGCAVTLERRVPGCPWRCQEGKQFGWNIIRHHSEIGLHPVVGVVKGEEHRHQRQHGVFRPPWLGLDAEEQVLERRGVQGGQTGVDAGCVSVDEATVAGRDGGHRGLRPAPKPVDAGQAVPFQSLAAQQGGEFAGRLSPQQVHLEEALLGVDEAQRARHIHPGAAANPRNPAGVA